MSVYIFFRNITSEEFLQYVRKSIGSRALPLDGYQPHSVPSSDDGTSSFMVLDRQGNAVACTTTINFL